MVLDNSLVSQLFIFILSTIVLVVSGNLVISTSKKISLYLKISQFAVGFMLLSVATSLPEIGVSLSAGLTRQGEIIIGNVIGSNIANILLVLGITAIIAQIKVKSKIADLAGLLFIISLIPLILLGRGSIGFFSGLTLLGIFLFYSFTISKKKSPVEIVDQTPAKKKLLTFALFGISMTLILFSASLLVDSSVKIAGLLNFPLTVISLFLVALGTSLPELIINISAILKKQYSMAVGNILGSCVVNLTLVLGAGAILTAIPIDFITIGSSAIFLLIVTTTLWYLVTKYRKLTKEMGYAFLALYAFFVLAEFGLLPLFGPNI